MRHKYEMKKINFFFLLLTNLIFAQQENIIFAEIVNEGKTILVKQTISFKNTTPNHILEIDLSDWNYALATKKSALANKFSDEFNRSFHLSTTKERANTVIESIIDNQKMNLNYYRDIVQPDIIHLKLNKPLKANEIGNYTFNYTLTLPSAQFTRFGWYNKDKIILKNCFLNVCAFRKGKFDKQSENNLDDLNTNLSNYSIFLSTKTPYFITSDLENKTFSQNQIHLSGNNKNNFIIILEAQKSYETFENNNQTIQTNLKPNQIHSYIKNFFIKRISSYIESKIGSNEKIKLVISEEDYLREPFYGLNELPNFISPFSPDFIFELKFLKTYLNTYLATLLRIDFRKDHWILEGIQHYFIKKYLDEFYPNMKAFGKLADFKLLKGYKIINMPFTEQFLYNYLLMARKNLDQPIGMEKDQLIKFNEKIAGKFKAGLLLNYTASLMGEKVFESKIKDFMTINKEQEEVSREDFYNLFSTSNNSNFWLKNLVEKDEIIDLKIKHSKRNNDQIQIAITSSLEYPIPYTYGLYKNKKLVEIVKDTIIKNKKIKFDRRKYDYIELNPANLLPEWDNRNNFKKFNHNIFGNKPLKFTFFKDIENPKYNQIFFVPTAEFNLYDGILLGMKFNNRSVIDQPIGFNIVPNYSTKTNTLAGSANLTYSKNYKNSDLYVSRYGVGLTRLHYLPDAFYTKIAPSISFHFRNPDLRKNEGQSVLLRQVYVYQEKSAFIKKQNENYSVFNLRYNYFKSELINQFSYSSDIQVANSFGKVSGSIGFRKLFENNKYITLRAFGGFFMYNDNKFSNFFSFGVDRPTDYLFDYPLLGRSESSGIYSQQYVNAEGGFKSKFDQRFANQYIFTINTSLNIWNWIGIYGDIGTYKSTGLQPKYKFDSGIHLNLVQDYFELFFPVYSSNGFELNDKNYGEKIRFVVTLSPKILTSLFTRRWF